MDRSLTYARRRGQLETYFDRTAAEAWARLTSDAPVGSIRATVRAGRDRMRAHLLGTLPEDLTGTRLLDAGCGTGALSVEAARRGATVVATDISPTLVGLAERRARELRVDGVEFRVGDMLDPSLGRFDFVVAMDSLIHYEAQDMVDMVDRLAAVAADKVAFTFAPRTPLLTLMHAVGRLFPRGNRAPSIEPIAPKRIRNLLVERSEREGLRWTLGEPHTVQSGFYTSCAMEVTKS